MSSLEVVHDYAGSTMPASTIMTKPDEKATIELAHQRECSAMI
jgi:hypothetical protein